MENLPLKEVKVIDFTMGGVGPTTANYLAYYGATVIKVESPTLPDGVRSMPPFKNGVYGHSYWFTYTLDAKRYAITLDLKHPKGKELSKKLIDWADVIIDSFTTGTLEKWGMDYDSLKETKPDLIMLRTCMHGHTGPLAKQHGQGFILTALSGLDNVTSWPDRPPAGLHGALTDHIAPLFNAISLMAAIDYRRRTGKGQYIDQSQHETVLHLIAPFILDWTTNHREICIDSNHIPNSAPHGIYRCLGEDRWCAIAVFTDEEWDNFCRVIGNPSLSKDPLFTTLLNRKQNEVELDKIVEKWTILHTREEVMALMQTAGIAAGVVSTSEDIANNPQLANYDYFQEVEHPEMGKLFVHGPIVRLSRTPYEIGHPPVLGENNDYVYTKILGLSDYEWVQLMEEGVI